jgi:MFS family permease
MQANQSKTHLAIIFATVFIYLVGFGIMIPIMPIIARDYGATPLQVGLLMSIYSIMQFVFAPLWGRVSDQKGRRIVLIMCMAGEAVSYLGFALSDTLTGLFVFRALAGVCGASISTASASISDVTDDSERSRSMALIGAAFGLGFLVGPALGGGLSWWGESLWGSPVAGMRFASFFVAGLCVVTAAMSFFFLKETVHLKAHKRSREQTESRLKLLGRYLRRPVTGTLIGNYFLNSFSMALMEATLVLLAADRFGWGIREVSFGFAYIGLISTLNQGVLVRKLIPILGERVLLYVGMGFQILGYTGIALAFDVNFLAWAMTLLSLGNGFVNPSLLGTISLSSPAAEQGEALGTAQSMAALGRILGPALGGSVYQWIHPSSPFVGSALLVGVGLLLAWRLGDRLPSSGKKQKTAVDVDRIGAYQFQNLVHNRVPFVLLTDDIPFEEIYSGLPLQHIQAVRVRVNFNHSPEHWVAQIKEKGIALSTPLVIFRMEGPLPDKTLSCLQNLYQGNICIMEQSWIAVKKDVIGGVV